MWECFNGLPFRLLHGRQVRFLSYLLGDVLHVHMSGQLKSLAALGGVAQVGFLVRVQEKHVTLQAPIAIIPDGGWATNKE